MPKTTRAPKKPAASQGPATTAPSYWLIKSEPTVYAWTRLQQDGRTMWDGVRNFEARNNLRAMKEGDLCLFYHSNEGKELVGVAKIVRAAYPDPTAPGEDWSVVDVAPAYPLKKTVGLDTIKETPELADLQMLTRNRLSVTRVNAAQWALLHGLAGTSSRPPKAKPAAGRPSR